jgi:outer membrane protein assembly factor BamB
MPRGRGPGQIDLDGNCSKPLPIFDPLTGNVYTSSDARTLYAIARDGRILWDVKQACKNGPVSVYPILNNEVVIACDNQALYSLRDGKLLWTSTLETTAGNFWSEVVFDGAGNIYAGAEETTPMPDLRAFDKSGKQLWKISTGNINKPSPIGFDSQGRLYVVVKGHVVSLSQ